jgi:hypothetical protein
MINVEFVVGFQIPHNAFLTLPSTTNSWPYASKTLTGRNTDDSEGAQTTANRHFVLVGARDTDASQAQVCFFQNSFSLLNDYCRE